MSSSPTRVLVLGATGMLGHTALRVFASSPGFEAWGAARSGAALSRLDEPLRTRVLTGVDVERTDSLVRVLENVRPACVVNAIGLVKQLADADDPLQAIPINSVLPHRLARLCALVGARLVHVSTDCVFAGTRGGYHENDPPDATDLYGRSKLLGEVDAPNALTLRTSIIGPELASAHGLVEWFLAQSGSVRGYTRAVFSGLPTVELARVIRDYVLPHPQLRGLYHVSAASIAKHDLLRLIAETYGREVEIVADDRVVVDRSLDSTRFRSATGYQAPAWPDLVRAMHAFG